MKSIYLIMSSYLFMTLVFSSCKENPVSSTSSFWEHARGLDSLYYDYGTIVSDSRGRVFVEANGGLFRSTDNGSSWTLVSPPTISFSWVLAIDANDNLYAAAYAGGQHGLVRSTDGGSSWTMGGSDFSKYGQIRSLAIDSQGRIFVVTVSQGELTPTESYIFRSLDNGESFMQIAYYQENPVWSIMIAPNNHVFANHGNSGVFRSTDNGTTWTQSGETFNDGDLVSLVANGSGHIFAGTWQSKTFRSTDDGLSWARVYDGHLIEELWFLAVDSKGRIFSCSQEFSPSGTTTGVIRFTNDGETWTQLGTDLLNTFIISMTINSNGYVIVGTINGIYRSAIPTM